VGERLGHTRLSWRCGLRGYAPLDCLTAEMPRHDYFMYVYATKTSTPTLILLYMSTASLRRRMARPAIHASCVFAHRCVPQSWNSKTTIQDSSWRRGSINIIMHRKYALMSIFHFYVWLHVREIDSALHGWYPHAQHLRLHTYGQSVGSQSGEK
jgi:hypothetical protein